jgi:hypothetical protein
MNDWTFVLAAYGVTGAGTFGLLAWAWRSMRTAESLTDSLKRRP